MTRSYKKKTQDLISRMIDTAAYSSANGKNDYQIKTLRECSSDLSGLFSTYSLKRWEESVPKLAMRSFRYRMHRLIKDCIELERATMNHDAAGICRNLVQIKRTIDGIPLSEEKVKKLTPIETHELDSIYNFSDENWLSVCINCHQMFTVDGPNEWYTHIDLLGGELKGEEVKPCKEADV